MVDRRFLSHILTSQNSFCYSNSTEFCRTASYGGITPRGDIEGHFFEIIDDNIWLFFRFNAFLLS